MIKFVIFILFAFSTSLSFGQEKYLVYFKDKKVPQHGELKKNSSEYSAALNSLSQKSVERRKNLLGQNFIDFKDIPINEAYTDKIMSYGVKIIWKLKWFNAVSCFITADQLDLIENLEFVDNVEPVKKISSSRKIAHSDNTGVLNKSQQTTSLDYGFSLTQNELSDIPDLHDRNINGKGIRIALLDSGFKFDSHPALDHVQVIDTYDFVYGDSDVGNDNDVSHGSGMLSLIAGFQEGFLIGPAFESEYVLAKTENIFGEKNIEEDNFAAAVEWAEALGVDIMSSSLGYDIFDNDQNSYTYEDMDGETAITTRAYEIAFSKGVLTITSAGNEGNKPWYYISSPADGKNTIAVGAVNSENNLAGFSSRGPTSDGRIKPEVLAMGINGVLADVGKNDYDMQNGTSISAPLVAGIAAQIKSVYPHLTNVQLRKILIESGDNVDNPDNDRGYGLVSAVRALTFPNLRSADGSFEINKIFIDENIDETTVKVEISINDGSAEVFNLQYDGHLIFTHKLSNLSTGDTIRFRYSYENTQGNLVYEPSGKQFQFIYGNHSISLSTSIDDEEAVPLGYKLMQNYPNPFNPSTIIEFYIPQTANVKITVFDILGQEVITLVDRVFNAGAYNSITWSGQNSSGNRMSSGAYFYQMITEEYTSVRKMIYLK